MIIKKKVICPLSGKITYSLIDFSQKVFEWKKVGFRDTDKNNFWRSVEHVSKSFPFQPL